MTLHPIGGRQTANVPSLDGLKARAKSRAYDRLSEIRPMGPDTRCPECSEKIDRLQRGPCCDCERKKVDELAREILRETWSEHVAVAWEQSGIPARHTDSRFGTFIEREGTEVPLACCREWAESFDQDETHRGLLLVGPWGSGKTHLAVSVAYRVLNRTYTRPMFTSVPGLIQDVKGGESLNREPIRRAIKAELLVLDDLGQAGRTDFDRETIYSIVSARYDAAAPMIVTSNLGLDRIGKLLGGALASRLHEATELLVLTASDYRQEKKAGAR